MTNSLIAAAINLVGMLLIYSLMANAITRYYWRGRGTLGVLGTIITAGSFWIAPTFLSSLRDLDYAPYPLWFGNWLGAGLSVVILCQSVRWIPRELEDSARLDGCGWFGIYRQVVLPLVWRELGLIALLTLMATSPVFWPSLTLPMGFLPPWLHLLVPFGSEGGVSSSRLYVMATAGSIIITLPVIMIFILAKRWFPRPPRLGNG
jgi:ABC-type glycerol-3-phosphate transport system permease component